MYLMVLSCGFLGGSSRLSYMLTASLQIVKYFEEYIYTYLLLTMVINPSNIVALNCGMKSLKMVLLLITT